MSCAQYSGSLIEAWLDGSWQAAVTCPYDASFGALTFGFMIYGGFITAMYVRTGSLVLPMVTTVLGGTIAISRLPSMAQQLAGMTLLLGFTVGAYIIYAKAQNIT